MEQKFHTPTNKSSTPPRTTVPLYNKVYNLLKTKGKKMAKQINFKAIEQRFQKMKRDAPRLIAGIAVEHYKKSFRDGGFTDDRLQPWKARKRGNKADRRTNKRRAILVDSGDLRRSIRARKFSFSEIAVGSYGTKYATFHNKGTRILPKRQFVGASHKMNLNIRLLIRKKIKIVLSGSD